MRVVYLVLLLALFRLNAPGASSRVLFEENFTKPLEGRWKDLKFSGHTDYKIVQEEGVSVLKATAKKSASGIVAEVKLPAKGQYKMQWRWKVDKTPAGASESDIDKFDHAARIFVAFKTAIGPPRTLNYAWSSSAKAGQTFHHPKSGRSRFIALESGDARAGKWITETRDLAADWKLLFGEGDLPEIVGIGIITDSDGVGGEVAGYYSDFKILRE